MPAKNRIKEYSDNGYYHIYNRGVEKRKIFQDQQDYAVFLSYLKEYLLPKNEQELMQKISDPTLSPKEKDKALKLLRLNNFHGEINLLAYCLMPNHFHFLIKQKSAGAMDKFMNSLGTRYTMYFNRKYKRVGALYQGVYKAVLVLSDEQLIHLSRYIHQQALEIMSNKLSDQVTKEIQPCSYAEYLGERKTVWIQPGEITAYFTKTNPTLSYQSFVQQEDNILIQKLVLED